MEQATSGKRKGGRKALWAAVAVIAIAAAGAVGYKITLEKTINAQLERRGGKATSVSADFLGHIKLTDVVLPLKNGTNVTIASIEGRPKVLFLNGMLDAKGIKTEIAQFKIEMPSVLIDDANFDIQMLRDTFGNGELSLAERVGRVSAKRMSVPEINIVQMLNDRNRRRLIKMSRWKTSFTGMSHVTLQVARHSILIFRCPMRTARLMKNVWLVRSAHRKARISTAFS